MPKSARVTERLIVPMSASDTRVVEKRASAEKMSKATHAETIAQLDRTDAALAHFVAKDKP